MIKMRTLGSLLLLGGVTVLAGCGGVRWEYSLEHGLQRAARENKRAFVQFYSMWNPGCQAMDRDVFTDPEVRRYLTEYVPIRIDPLWHKPMMIQHEIHKLPAFLIFRPDRELAGSHQGVFTADELGIFLIKHHRS